MGYKTVRQFMMEHKEENLPFYLTPNILSNQTFSEPRHHFGHEVFNIGSVNEEIIDKAVVKSWHEDDKIIIIWKKE